MVEPQLRIVRLLDPEMCLACPFARMVDVEDAQGERSRMVRCRRLDCDNWETVGAEAARSVTPVDEPS